MRCVIQITVVLILGFAFSRNTLAGKEPSPPQAQATPIPLSNVAFEAQAALESLREIDEKLSKIQSSTAAVTASLSSLTDEIGPRMAEDSRLLRASPPLDILYRIKLTWLDLGDLLSALVRELTLDAKSLEEELARLDQLDKAWQATLELAKQRDTPLPALQSVQSIVDSIERTRQLVESARAEVLTILSRLSDEETGVRRTLSLAQVSAENGKNKLANRSRHK
jgi:hypothetical protein